MIQVGELNKGVLDRGGSQFIGFPQHKFECRISEDSFAGREVGWPLIIGARTTWERR